MTTPTTSSGSRSASLSSARVSKQARWSASAATWAAVRGTGLILSVLVLGHLLVVHIFTDVSKTNAGFVARRWSSALWLSWDGLMLSAALLHGAIGMSVVIRDYVPRQALRRWAYGGLIAGSLALAALGWYAIAATVLSAPWGAT